jgi:hypothetical protein
MSGWVTPATPPGPVAWEAPEETPGLGVRQLVGGAWGLYRSAGRRLLLVATVPALIQALLALPSIALGVVLIRKMVEVFGEFSRFRTDPLAFQAEFQAAMRPPTDLTVLAAVAGGISIAVLVIGWAGLTSAALAVSEGRTVSIASAYAPVFARRAGIVIPAVVVGATWAVISAAQAFIQPTGSVVMSASQLAFYSVISLLILVVSVGAFVLVVTWSLGLPAILAEGLDLRRGLARGAELTRGIRFRLGLAFIVVWILQGLTVGILAGLAGLIGGLLARSVEAGAVVYFAALLIGGVLWLPFLPAMLALAYRDRTTPDEDVTGAEGSPAVDATPGVDGAASLIDGG